MNFCPSFILENLLLSLQLYWGKQDAFNLTGGTTGFNKAQTKLPSYWSTNFSKICLGMMIDNHVRFVVINKQASSLFSLIADRHYQATHLGRGNWMSLVGPTASLEPHCNQEGWSVNLAQGKNRFGR